MERSTTKTRIPPEHSTHAYTPEFYDALMTACEGYLARYPDVADRSRMHRGVQLVLSGHVLRHAHGYTVRSQTRPGRVYQSNGACQCEDYVQERAPEGRCCHRWAVSLYKRALQESMPAHWVVTHSEALRDELAAKGHLPAVVAAKGASFEGHWHGMR